MTEQRWRTTKEKSSSITLVAHKENVVREITAVNAIFTKGGFWNLLNTVYCSF